MVNLHRRNATPVHSVPFHPPILSLAWASVRLGSPASAGAWSAQFGMAATGLIQIGAPRSHAVASSPRWLTRGMALRAFGHLFNQVSAAFYFSLCSRSWYRKPPLEALVEIAINAIPQPSSHQDHLDNTLMSPHFRPNLERCGFKSQTAFHRKEPMF